MNRVYLSPSDRDTVRAQAAITTAALARGDYAAIGAPPSSGKASRVGLAWEETCDRLCPLVGRLYAAPTCDPTPRGIAQSFLSRVSSFGPVVPFSRETHHTTATHRFWGRFSIPATRRYCA